MNIYGKLNESFQQNGGSQEPDMILMEGERPSIKHVARANGTWEIDLGNEMIRLLNEVNTIYQEKMKVLTSVYPLEERESFDKQVKEAEAFLSDNGARTPWLDACANVRGITKEELANRIIAKDAAFAIMHGTLTGVRQKHEDNILEIPNIYVAEKYNVNEFWPTEEEIDDN